MLRVAIVIGIGFANKDAPLEYCPPSAKDVYDLLTSSEYGQCDLDYSLLITDEQSAVTQETLEKTIKDKLNQVESNDTIIFYYTGHASSLENELFLETSNSDKTIDGYRISNLIREVRDRNMKLILIVDACESTVAFETLNQFSGKYDKAIVILVSCGRYEYSHQELSLERTLFSYYFCEGLKHGCEGHIRRTDGIVDVSTIKEHVNIRISQEYPLLAKQQEARVTILSEGKEKLWIARTTKLVPLVKNITPTLTFTGRSTIKNELKALQNLYRTGYIMPEKCNKTVNKLKTIRDFLENDTQTSVAACDIIVHRLSIVISDVTLFKNHCQDSTGYASELRANIVDSLTEILSDLDYL